MRGKHWTIVLCMAVMLISSVSGCSREQNTESGLEGTKDKTPITFTYYSADGQEDPWTDPVAMAITKATGVTLKTEYPVNGSNDKIKLMLVSGEYPDLIFAKGDGAILIEKGALLDLTDLIETYGDNIKKLYGDQFDKLRNSVEDPSIYQLACSPVDNRIFTTAGSAQLQWAVLAYNDYEIPYTLEEYEKQIKSYMEAYPTINGKKTLGISISCSDWRWYITLANPSGFVNGYPDNGQWVVDDDDDYAVYYKHMSSGQYEYYKWLNRMYNEGVLDSDFATQQYEDYMAKIAEGRVLGLLDSKWDYEDAEKILKANDQYDRTYAGLPVTLNEDITSTILYDQGLSTGWGLAITKNCSNPERLMQFLDWMCSEEAQILLNWGIEGVNYEVDENGKRYVTEEEQQKKETDIDYEIKTGVGFHSYPFPRFGDGALDSNGDYYTTNNEASTIANYNEEEKKALAAWGADTLLDIFPSPESFGRVSPYGAIYQWSMPAQVEDYEAELDAVSYNYLVKSIICSQEDFDGIWEEFQTALINTGALKANEIVTDFLHSKLDAWSDTE